MMSGDRDEAVKEKMADFGGLIDEQTAKLLVEYESRSLSEEKIKKVAEKNSKLLTSTLNVLVIEKEGIREYTKKNGEKGKYLSIKLVTEGGKEGRLLFWDAQIEEVKEELIKEGQVLTLINCNPSNGKYGLTFVAGQDGVVLAGSQFAFRPNKL
ncbi:MAG: hypothetical protein QXP70_01155 [Methanomassiliicoccales archaeon]